MTTKTLKKIGIFCGLLIVSANCVPILATIASIVLGIVSVFLIVAMPIACFFTNGRKRLSNPFQHLPTLKLFHFPFLLFVVALVLFTPALFALSLILHWYCAAQIILGIVASLLVLAITVVSFLCYSRKSYNKSLDPKLEVKKGKENDGKYVSEVKRQNNLGEEVSTWDKFQNVFSDLEYMDEKDSIPDQIK
ncbi:MAG: hypothetical protein IJU86_04505 [Firmicutes bacterium]|nr:hypothetical protein [Bacillota bacterium]